MSSIGVIPALIPISPLPIPAIAIPYLIKSLIDLGIEYKELASMRTEDGIIHNVDVLIKDQNGKEIGFEKTKNANYQLVINSKGLDDTQIKKQQNLIKKISQRYAYNKTVDELKKQGYIITEEEKIANNTIRIAARKW